MPELRQYEKLWLEIASANKPVTVACRRTLAQTLIQAVRKEKCRYNMRRSALDLPRYGKLKHSMTEDQTDPARVKIVFELAYNGDML